MTRLPSLGPRGEGWVALQILGLGLVVLAARFAPSETSSGIPTATAWIGGAVMLLGVAVVIAGSIELRRAAAFTVLPDPRPGGKLVETGPYRYIRNPIYAGLILASLGWALMRLSVLATLAAVFLAVVLDLKRRREEQWLVERFPGYAAYRERTKAFVPFVY
jgi:protein-S-isoprenylcysteine O-methyltransferase Ste14